ncbi:MAG: sarcosine oxidase subunit gamma family protein [Ectothiorhodospiraceae bacterium]|jgi:sarcosine oxidase subunit gamma
MTENNATPRAESPLHHAELDLLAAHPNEGEVVLREKRLLGLFTLRGDSSDAGFRSAVASVLGAEPPTEPMTSVDTDRAGVLWYSPDEWLVIADGADLPAQGSVEHPLVAELREALAGVHSQVVDNSGGYTLLEVSGPKAEEMLHKCTIYDVHERSLPVGKVVGSVFATKTAAYIRRIREDAFELVIRRSFADYIWLWIQEQSREYGLVIAESVDGKREALPATMATAQGATG